MRPAKAAKTTTAPTRFNISRRLQTGRTRDKIGAPFAFYARGNRPAPGPAQLHFAYSYARFAHREKDGRGVLDALREIRPPFSPDSAVIEFAALLKSYKVYRVVGDRYGGEWPRERFSAHGIRYEPSDKPKSQIYQDLLPLLNSGKVELLDNTRLITQLVGLERRTARGGRDSIDHAPGSHDDVANAAAGALVLIAQRDKPIVISDVARLRAKLPTRHSATRSSADRSGAALF